MAESKMIRLSHYYNKGTMLTEDILKAMDGKKQVDLVLLDFCKAFDKIPHKRLLNKLKKIWYSI